MLIINDLPEWQIIRTRLPKSLRLGAVLTMGNLHQGHASLISRSIKENDLTVVTVFVNPTQFNNPDDYQHYPKTFDEDSALLEHLGVDYCLAPSASALYPDDYTFQVSEHQLSQLMEGTSRAGHFTGMLTVVLKFLLLIKPHHIYFGEKDYQQLELVKGLAQSFFLETKVIGCPTIREHSNLACSSRNNRLNQEQRALAATFAEIFHHGQDCTSIKEQLQSIGITVDYIEEFQQRRFAAVYIDGVRLIDNYVIE